MGRTSRLAASGRRLGQGKLHWISPGFLLRLPSPSAHPCRCRVFWGWHCPSWGAWWSLWHLVSRPNLTQAENPFPEQCCTPSLLLSHFLPNPPLRQGPRESRHRGWAAGTEEQVALAGEPPHAAHLLDTCLRRLPHPPAVGANGCTLPRTVSVGNEGRGGWAGGTCALCSSHPHAFPTVQSRIPQI